MYNTSQNYKDKILADSTQHELNIYIDGNKVDSNHIIDFNQTLELFNNSEFCLGCTPEKDIEFEIDKRDLPESYNEVYVETGVKYHEDIITEGENITVKEEEEIPLNLEIYGNSKQDEEPSLDYPSEVKSCGGNVNLFDVTKKPDVLGGKAINGLGGTDYTKIENGYRFLGRYNSIGFVFENLTKGKEYTVSFYVEVNNSPAYCQFQYGLNRQANSSADKIAVEAMGIKEGNTIRQKRKFSFVCLDDYNIVAFGIYSTTVLDGIICDITDIKLEQGSTATPYSPYGQGCINEVVGNKNLINIDEIEWKVYYTADGTLDTSENWGISKIKALSNTQYYLSGNKVNNSNACIVLLNKNKEFIKTVGYYNKVQLINTTNDTCYIGISIPKYTNGQGDDTTTIMLEQGSTATDYVEHQSQTFTIPTQQPMRAIGDYKDTFIKVDGKWFEKHYIERKVFDGTEDWAYHRENYRFYKTLERIPLVSQAGKVLSSHFKNGNTETDNNTFNIGSKEIFFRNENITSISDWKTWLLAQYEAGTPVYVDYVLSEPTNLECTEEQNKILEELENAKSYKGVTHIYSTDEVEPNVEVIYKKDMQIENEKLQSQIDEIKQLLSTTQTSALLLDNLQTDIESEVE